MAQPHAASEERDLALLVGAVWVGRRMSAIGYPADAQADNREALPLGVVAANCRHVRIGMRQGTHLTIHRKVGGEHGSDEATRPGDGDAPGMIHGVHAIGPHTNAAAGWPDRTRPRVPAREADGSHHTASRLVSGGATLDRLVS